MMPKRTEFNTISKLQDHARAMIREGYVVLVAEAPECGHWIGYSAFKMVDGVEDSHLLTFSDQADLPNADPAAIYQTN